jgi:fido (protein-threonine AMPylation protein)
MDNTDVLRNLLNIKDAKLLEEAETRIFEDAIRRG